VWFHSLEDAKVNRALETSTFADEPIALMMQVFRRVKIDIESVTEKKILSKYGKTPCFVIITPTAEVLGILKGKSAGSRSRFKGFLSKSFSQLFKTPVKAYLKAMTGILNRLDSVSGKRTVLNAKKARLAKKPNAAKARSLERETKKLDEVEAKIEADEEEIKKACVLKKKWLPESEKAGEK